MTTNSVHNLEVQKLKTKASPDDQFIPHILKTSRLCVAEAAFGEDLPF